MTEPGSARLFIAEKPSVAAALADQLGQPVRKPGYFQCGSDVVSYCFGHLLELAEPDAYLRDDAPTARNGRKRWRDQDLPIVPRSWLLLPKEDAKQQLDVLRRLLSAATTVVNAGDPDREGQLLVDEVLEHFSYKGPVLRFWSSAQDPVSLQRALAALKSNDGYHGLAEAARARQRADWLVGMNLSRALTLRAASQGADTLLTVGRVQTPTLGLVVQRDRAIENFTARDYYPIACDLVAGTESFQALWQASEGAAGLDGEGRLVDRAVAERVERDLDQAVGTISKVSADKKHQGPPLAYSLSRLTQELSRRVGATAQQVLDACQALYEKHKVTSYPRSDCGYLPEAQRADAPAVLAAAFENVASARALESLVDVARRSKTWNDKKVTAHHGIIPTTMSVDPSRLQPLEAVAYELICRRYIAQFLGDHVYLASRIEAAFGEHRVATTGRQVLEQGWKTANGAQGSEREDEGDASLLPQLLEGQSVTCANATIKSAKTKPPAHFTEGTLLAAMERIHTVVEDPAHKKHLKDGDGLGTPATRAAIISDLQKRGFIVAEGKTLKSSQTGRVLVDVLPAVITSPALTALYERFLSEVEAGTRSLSDFLSKQTDFVCAQVEAIRAASLAQLIPAPQPCPVCGDSLSRKGGGGGRSVWRCGGCQLQFADSGGKPVLASSKKRRRRKSASKTSEMRGGRHGRTA